MARAKKQPAAKKAPKQKKAEVHEVDADGVEVAKGGMDFEDSIVITTALALVGAVVMMYMVVENYA